ncbi:MAG: EamA family transporter RarD [Alphaproteobacteria bacterium]|jgi:chloramphenicol-sensitive protein RarD|nr:EamA family transporter RarD [Alphaproteobacteria bacterium]MBT4966760.1 EamA family transporter RarD [Alphaproteobacteria bacterium]MBT5158435.1 EamA family transporter RarD [Alphaproteobacteria bacterium]
MSSPEEQSAEVQKGLAFGLGAFLIWGGLPNLFKLVDHVPALETLSWRTFSSIVFLLLLIAVTNRWRRLRTALRSKRLMGTLVITTALLGLNWWVFVYAVNIGEVLQVSLGYYINPLFSVLLGFFLLGERLSRLQVGAVLIAGAGVLNQTLTLGVFPWASLGMAVLFGLYGYVRKVAKVEAIEGLLIETALLSPFAIGYVWWLEAQGTATVSPDDSQTIFYLLVIGVFTAVPLIFFTEGARRLRLSTVGLLQYIAPTLHLVGAVWLWGETLTTTHIITFACIWLALGLYSTPSILAAFRAKS